MYVYVNGYGLRPFRAVEKKMFNNDPSLLQLRGQYKLPPNIKTNSGKKWIDLDYWFSLDQVKDTMV